MEERVSTPSPSYAGKTGWWCLGPFRSRSTIFCTTVTWAIWQARRGHPGSDRVPGRRQIGSGEGGLGGGNHLDPGHRPSAAPDARETVRRMDGGEHRRAARLHGTPGNLGRWRAVQVPGHLDGLRNRSASARRAMDSGALRPGTGSGDVLVLRPSQQAVVQCFPNCSDSCRMTVSASLCNRVRRTQRSVGGKLDIHIRKV